MNSAIADDAFAIGARTGRTAAPADCEAAGNAMIAMRLLAMSEIERAFLLPRERRY